MGAATSAFVARVAGLARARRVLRVLTIAGFATARRARRADRGAARSLVLRSACWADFFLARFFSAVRLARSFDLAGTADSSL
jgi:hypothetical protein